MKSISLSANGFSNTLQLPVVINRVKKRAKLQNIYKDYSKLVTIHDKVEKTVNVLEFSKQYALNTKALIAKHQIIIKAFTLLDMAQFDIQETGKIIFVISLLRILYKRNADHLYPFHTEQLIFLLVLGIYN
jgi:hypothetical protein